MGPNACSMVRDNGTSSCVGSLEVYCYGHNDYRGAIDTLRSRLSKG